MTIQAPLVHADFTFPGIEMGLVFGTPESKLQKNEVFGLDGATGLDGGKGIREITCEMWLFNNYSNIAQLNTLLRAITDHVNVKGQLVDSLGSTFEDVIFRKQEPVRGHLYDPEMGVWKHVRLIFEDMQP